MDVFLRRMLEITHAHTRAARGELENSFQSTMQSRGSSCLERRAFGGHDVTSQPTAAAGLALSRPRPRRLLWGWPVKLVKVHYGRGTALGWLP